MSAILNEDWTAEIVGRMHRFKIRNEQLAQECGYTAAYLSTVLNGNKDLSEKGKEETKNRIFEALERIESRILTTGNAEADADDNTDTDTDIKNNNSNE